MPVVNMVKAITAALRERLTSDESVVVFGEDVGYEGGVFRVTEGLQRDYSEERVFDTPLAESAIVGAALGMCCAGLRPVVEIQFSGFVYPAFNQIISHVSRFRNRTRGRYPVPMVIRMPYGGGVNALEHHSESMEALFAHIPGLRVVIPSTPHDAKGLLTAAVESDDPVVFMEPKRLYRAVKQEVPDGRVSIPLGRGKIISGGTDITVVAYGAMMRQTLRAAALAKRHGISPEIIDLRSIYPVDRELIAESVRRTGRLLVVTEGPSTCGVGSEIVSTAVEEAFLRLEAPPTRLGGFDTVIPLPQGERYYQHEPERIYYEIKKLCEY
jgi:pyruvate dehydrogenase E1 component beta subunit